MVINVIKVANFGLLLIAIQTSTRLATALKKYRNHNTNFWSCDVVSDSVKLGLSTTYIFSKTCTTLIWSVKCLSRLRRSHCRHFCGAGREVEATKVAVAYSIVTFERIFLRIRVLI